MSKIRLFVECALGAGADVTLDKEQSHYLASVMRIKAGDQVALFNGCDGEWQASVNEAHKRAVCLNIVSQNRVQEKEPDLWLAFAPIKKGRLDFMVQKATEMGVSHLLPMMTQYTNVDRMKIERLRANVLEAAEQCDRLQVPKVTELSKLETVLKEWPENRMIMFCDEDLSGRSALDALAASDDKKNPKPWGIVIGPEGGFSPSERALINAHKNCIAVSLGPRILRADTAAIAALSLWQTALGDW